MKYLRLTVIGALIGLGATLFVKLLHSNSPTACNAPYRHDVSISANGSLILAEKASTSAAQAKGLGERACISADEGMLFPLSKSGYYPFWMKDMKFPIDMVWISTDRKVVTIKANVAPSTYPHTFVNSAPAQYVLELKAGQAKVDGLQQGSSLNF